ncbi:hypothetical protein N7G274_002485 [Stereocaulon virgatum]|uniref:BZIP domain-containing protein n=1 Tax=Stereocaulon virgatum TaxID=373712 RepID=A0ABR4AGS4_9LECA
MNGTAFGPDLSLTPSQEGLHRKALSSNNPTSTPQRNLGTRPSASARSSSDPRYNANSTMANGVDTYTSPIQQTPGSGQPSNFDESPSLDYDLDDGTFDWVNSCNQLFGDLHGTEYNDDGEHHDKRKAASGEDGEEEGSSKRREGNDKGAKKPGRKPLTGEPTTKRKAQNRAAQRAFRERKERHLKDLETKVEELEKTSETTSHENGRLRAQVEKLNMELKEYRKRLSLNCTGVSHSPPPSANRSFYNSNGSDFQFAFPKFGDLPGTFMNNGSLAKTTSPPLAGQRSTSVSSTSLPGFARKQSSGSASAKSLTNLNGTTASPQTYQRSSNSFDSNIYCELSGLFSPSILENASRSSSSDYLSFPGNKPASLNGLASISSTNGQAHVANGRHASAASITNSPASSMSHALDSSCGTTPESSADSPDNRKSSEGNLKTISEETMIQSKPGATSQTVKSPAADINGIDRFAQQNGGQFDPVLFGGYRDPQDNILSNNTFGDFFNDAFPTQDFSSPYNTGDFISPPTKQDLMQQVDKQKESSPLEMVPTDDARTFIACDKLWDRVQTSKRAQSGQVDMDDLCSQLKSKAKCSGKGAIIAEKDVDAILGPATPAIGEPTDLFKMFS